MSDSLRAGIIIIIYSFNVKLTSATFNNVYLSQDHSGTQMYSRVRWGLTNRMVTGNLYWLRSCLSLKACKRKRLIVCPKAKNNFNETYFQKLLLQTEQISGFMAKNTKNRQTNKPSCYEASQLGPLSLVPLVE